MILFQRSNAISKAMQNLSQHERDGEGGGLLVNVKKGIAMRQLKSFNFEMDMECI